MVDIAHFAIHDQGISDVTVIVDILTDAQKHCIKQLSEDWTDTGYSKVTADLIFATDSTTFPDRFNPLIDCQFYREQGRSPSFKHRLLPLGMEVKTYLERTEYADKNHHFYKIDYCCNTLRNWVLRMAHRCSRKPH